jgi:UDP-N-acetylmuramoyl-tripeptide--D-alanyl-D-alanine ligase
MKSKKLIFLEKVLRLMAIVVLRRHKPKIVAVTGSVGKTSAREAIFTVLSAKYKVRENLKNYNNEIGIPLTIIGGESGGKNIFKWLWIFFKWLLIIIFPKYPEILIFELGVDRPGDMKYFMSFIKPDVGVVTNVSLSHIEFFKTVENIAKEKRILIESLPVDGFAILNADDELTSQMGSHTKAQILTYGQNENASVVASNLVYNYQENKLAGISFKLNYDGKNIPIRLKNILAAHYVYAALVAIGAGIVFKINLVDIAEALESLRAPAGRFNLFAGMNGSNIIDDTYNASPMSVVSALDILGQLEVKRKIAVLGDMLELGEQTEFRHKDVGKKIFSVKADIFIAVGKRMQYAAEQLVALGFPRSNIFHFDDPETAAEKVSQIAQEGDYILVKGSQGMRMEKVVERILADPAQAKDLLCRQNKEWKRKPFVSP